ncbi:MAG: MlaD family protein, partial [Desulfovibrionaceae bacterium]|nr:MlaD family protein [Desulfovibrionaceae bacterium]
MSSHASKTAVGAFVLGGIALLVLAIVLLGGNNLFNDDAEYVLYFDGSVSGLSVGAPVVFRGVPLGSVTRISLVVRPSGFTSKTDNLQNASPASLVTIPVYIRIDKKSLMRSSGGGFSEEMQQKILRCMVQDGLRARLQLQSMITGQYRIELDFHPDSPATFHSATPDLEIPTLPSPIDTLQRSLAKLPLEEMAYSLNAILSSLSHALADDKLKEGIAAFADSFAEVQKILTASPLRTALDDT